MARIAVILLGLLIANQAVAQTTLCPTVSDQVSIIGVTVTGTPYPFDYASYDLETSYLTIAYQYQTSQMLIGVPNTYVTSGQPIAWVSVSGYPSAVMQQRSTCPLLSQNIAVTGLPLLAQTGQALLLQTGGVILAESTYTAPGPPILAQ